MENKTIIRLKTDGTEGICSLAELEECERQAMVDAGVDERNIFVDKETDYIRIR